MSTKVLLGRNFINAMKPMLGITTGIKSLTIHADIHSMAEAVVEVYMQPVDINIDEVEVNQETKTRRFIFDVTEVIDD